MHESPKGAGRFGTMVNMHRICGFRGPQLNSGASLAPRDPLIHPKLKRSDLEYVFWHQGKSKLREWRRKANEIVAKLPLPRMRGASRASLTYRIGSDVTSSAISLLYLTAPAAHWLRAQGQEK